MESLDVRSIILELLSDRATEFGARLKQRLNRTLIQSGIPAFSEREYGYRKFSDFLIAELGHHLQIDKPSIDGDIQISLKADAPSFAPPYTRVAAVSAAPVSDQVTIKATFPIVRGDVWQAFTNLNPQRKRYWEKSVGQILHFLEDSDSDQAQQVAALPDAFTEIPLVEGDTQLGWMHEFLAVSDFPDDEVASLRRLVAEGYSSRLNMLFARSLGQQQSQWKRYRAQRVIDIIRDWAQTNSVPIDRLMIAPPITAEVVVTPVDKTTPVGVMSPRSQAEKLLSLMDEQDIISVALPTLLGCVLAKSRL
jgi:hypothetical protein